VAFGGAGVPSVYVVGVESGYTNQVSFTIPAHGAVVALELAGQWCTIAAESVYGPFAVARDILVLGSSEIASVIGFHILKFQKPFTGRMEPTQVVKLYSFVWSYPEGTNVILRMCSVPPVPVTMPVAQEGVLVFDASKCAAK